MRLFVAIDLDENAREAIGAEQRRLMHALGTVRSLRWVRPADMHLTLAFLGETDQSRAQAIVGAMGAALAATPFVIAFTGLGVFPPRGAPSVLWIGVGAGRHELIAVERAVADRLERAGVARERRPYHPHLTLARWRAARPGDRQRVVGADSGGDVARVTVASVVLYQSRLASTGPTYNVLARAPLES